MGKTLWETQNLSINGFFPGKHHPVPAVDISRRNGGLFGCQVHATPSTITGGLAH